MSPLPAKYYFISIGLILLYGLSSQLLAQHKKSPEKKILSYQLDKALNLAGDGPYDELLADQASRKLYIAHGTVVQVVDMDSLKLVATLTGFQEAHSMAIVEQVNRIYITDGKTNSVKVFDTRNFESFGTIPLTGREPHNIIQDLNSNVLFAFNWGSRNASIVDPIGMKEFGNVDLGGNPELGFSDANGLMYNSLEDRNLMVIIATKSKKVFRRIPLEPCMVPTAMAYDALNARIFIGCRENKALSIINALNGKTLSTLPIGEGVGTIAYDPETKLILVACNDGVINVIKQKSIDLYEQIQLLSTPHSSRSMALDNKTSRIFLATAGLNEATQQNIPATFKIQVYTRKLNVLKTLTKM